jgi:hypothetical protein
MAAALVVEAIGEVLAAMIVAQFDAASNVSPRRAEDAGDSRGNGLIGREAIPTRADVVTEALAVPVLDGTEQLQPAVVRRPHLRAIGGPAHARGMGDDAPIVRFGGHRHRPVWLRAGGELSSGAEGGYSPGGALRCHAAGRRLCDGLHR